MKATYAARHVGIQWCLVLVSMIAMLSTVAPVSAQPIAGPRPAQAALLKPVPTMPPTVLVMGDSLSAAYGLQTAQGWVALTADRIAQQTPGWRLINASISGETTAGGSSRVVAEVLRVRPAVLVIELGANDALRGLPLREMRRNLARMIGAAQYVGARVLLIGMRIPPNYGPDYAQGFEQTYRDLATLFDVELLPFLLEPIALDSSAFQPDNLHPVARVQPQIRDHVWTALGPMLGTARRP